MSGNDTGKGVAVLVLGVGNDMMGDEGIGVRVVRQMRKDFVFPAAVDIVDGGVGGLALLPSIRAADEVVIVDAIDASSKPGSVFMFNSEEIEFETSSKLSLHDMGMMEVLRTAALMDDGVDATIIGIQPKRMDEFGSGLSRQVSRKIPQVIEIILDLLAARGIIPELRRSCSMVETSEWSDRA